MSSSSKFFSQNPTVKYPRSSFNRSHGGKTTFDAGYLIPIFVDQAIPGDTMSVDLEGLARLATPLKPTMDNLYLETFFFFIPRRLTWTNFQRYMGEQDNPGDSIDYLLPQVVMEDAVGAGVMSIFDYMKVPVGLENVAVRADIFRSYNLVWNQWFRDEDLQNSVTVPLGDGPDSHTNYTLLRRGKRADYFTTCRLTPQKGPSVLIPGTDYLPVHGIGKFNQVYSSTNITPWESDGTGPGAGGHTYAKASVVDDGVDAARFYIEEQPVAQGWPNIHVDLTENTEGTINALRMAEAMQVFYERQMRGGSRYIEQNRYQFGVVSSDARLQRAEFLGGGQSLVTISPVAQTSDTGAGTPQGNLAGFGKAHLRGHGFTRSFEEHGIVLGLMCCRADLNYQNALERWYTVRSRDEEYFPPFGNLGDMAVLNKEIYLQAAEVPENEDVFGYQERFSDYKQKFSMITGLFRSNVSGSLDVWHYAQDFDALPELGSTFIQENPPIDRTIAVPSQPHFLFDWNTRFHHTRVMTTRSVPGMGVRF